MPGRHLNLVRNLNYEPYVPPYITDGKIDELECRMANDLDLILTKCSAALEVLDCEKVCFTPVEGNARCSAQSEDPYSWTQSDHLFIPGLVDILHANVGEDHAGRGQLSR